MGMITATLISHHLANNGHNFGILHLMVSIIDGQVLQANQPNPLTSSNYRKLRTYPNQFN